MAFVHGMLLQWIRNLFTGRTFCTKINQFLSDVACLLSSVIHGSTVGLLMFLIYDDFVELGLIVQYGITVKLFADDVKPYLKVVNQIDIRVAST